METKLNWTHFCANYNQLTLHTLIYFVPLLSSNLWQYQWAVKEPIFSVIHLGLKYICQICRFHPWIWFGAFEGDVDEVQIQPKKDSYLLPDFWILLSLLVLVGWLDQLCSYCGGQLDHYLVDYICSTVPSVLGAPSQAICHPSTRDTSLRLTEGPVIFWF